MPSFVELRAAAETARENAYAPYSNYKVGAAVLDDQGGIWTGCNVENVSYPAGICAERTAIVKMVSEGRRVIRAVAVATRDGGTPCGICLQVMLEFAPDPHEVQVHTISEDGASACYKLSELIPHGFCSKDLGRT